MITADTITDDMIRRLREHAWDQIDDRAQLERVHVDCGIALARFRHPEGIAEVRAARGRLAAFLTAQGPCYSPRVERAIAAVDGWTAQDFIDLALAGADQAGASVREQEQIAEILNARAKEAK